jgi:ABC-2 type transport system ATP-binding protein
LIEVSELSKNYGITRAVDALSFTVERGEVLGFLGPNGAGKTTTMKMLTCYLPPSSGTASIFGFDILKDSIEVRRRIGYLPEKNPLYGDMDVTSFLEFAARLKGVAKGALNGSVATVIERCGLGGVSRRRIGNLSKGFQQRVGIAQAIVNDPELLILDEPTIGLDPRQIIDIRTLIKELGRDRTVILSSHILPEVSQVCDRIIIINNGRLVAVDSPDNLRGRLKRSSTTRVRVAGSADPGDAERVISSIAAARVIRVEGPGGDGSSLLTVESSSDSDIRGALARALIEGGIPLLEIYSEELSLEDIFIRLVTSEGDA